MLYHIFRPLLGSLRRKLELTVNQAKWRKKNKHNETCPINIFPLEKVKVGRYTYGDLQVYCYRNPDEFLSIGDFCSIASDVIFILGGEHNIQRLTSYPFEEKFAGKLCESKTKGPVIVEDDVWIGARCLILSGVRIGRGSIIAAGSVVYKDIPPYTIYANGKIIKKRFSDYVAESLSRIDFSNVNKDKILNNIDLIRQKVTEENVDKFLSVFC